VCCNALQRVAACCSVLQCVAVLEADTGSNLLIHGVSILQVCCSVLQCVAACCSVLQCVVV